jgi:hypothetical protein
MRDFFEKARWSARSLPAIPTWLGIQKNLTVLSVRIRQYTKDLMMITRVDREDKNELEDIVKRHDCELDKIRKELNSNVKVNCRALIIA